MWGIWFIGALGLGCLVERPSQDTDAVDNAVYAGDRVSVVSGAAVRSSSRFQLKVAVGEPITAKQRQTDRYTLRVGVGTF